MTKPFAFCTASIGTSGWLHNTSWVSLKLLRVAFATFARLLQLTLLAAAGKFLMVALSTYAGYAQVTTATFYSTVTDSSGAVIPGATVRLKNDATGAVATKTTDSSGECVFEFLHVGVYTLQIEAKGFKRFESKSNAFDAGQEVSRTYVMEVGSMTEAVSVEA